MSMLVSFHSQLSICLFYVNDLSGGTKYAIIQDMDSSFINRIGRITIGSCFIKILNNKFRCYTVD